MIDERQEELASLYAFDLLDGAERAQFEAMLGRNPELQKLVDELRATTTKLAHTAPAAEPPAELKTRILATTSSRPPAADETKVVPFPTRPTRMLPWAIAASLALCTAWLGQRYTTAQAQADLLQQQQAIAEVALKSATARIEAEQILARGTLANFETLRTETAAQIAEAQRRASETERKLSEAEQRAGAAQAQIVALNDQLKQQGDLAQLKIATLASMLHNSPQALAVAVWDPRRQQGVFTVDKLPANAADQRYELWVIDSKPVSAGVFTVGADGRARVTFQPTDKIVTAAKFAISREKNDGIRAHATPGEVIMISE